MARVTRSGGPDRSDGPATAVALLLVSGVVVATVAGFAHGLWLANLHNGLLALAFGLVGAYVVHQQPRNRCGWVFLATGVVEAVMFLGRQIGHDPGPGTSPWWGWLGVWPLALGLALVTLAVILFPTGTLSPGWNWVIRVGAVLTAALVTLTALWSVGEAAASVVTPHPFSIAGTETAKHLWDVAARPTYVAFQVVWLVAVVTRWRTSSRGTRRQLTIVGVAVAASLLALAVGLVGWGTPTAGVLTVCLVPVAAGWAIVHGQSLATHSALTWLTRRSDDDTALSAELAEAIAESLAADHVVVWVRRNNGYHAVGMWPEPVDEMVPVNDVDQPEIGTGQPTETRRVIARGDAELGVVVVDRPQPLSRHDLQLLDGFCGQAVLVLENLATASKLAGSPATGNLDHLTPRELEVLALMAEGLTNAAICDQLHLSIKTVEPAVGSIFTKLDLPPGRKSNRRVLAVLVYVDKYRTSSLERA